MNLCEQQKNLICCQKQNAVDREDIDSLVEQNINAHMFDLPKID